MNFFPKPNLPGTPNIPLTEQLAMKEWTSSCGSSALAFVSTIT
jgi:hypothetical protein